MDNDLYRPKVDDQGRSIEDERVVDDGNNYNPYSNEPYDENSEYASDEPYDENGEYASDELYDENGNYVGDDMYDENGNYIGDDMYDEDGNYVGDDGLYDENGNYIGDEDAYGGDVSDTSTQVGVGENRPWLNDATRESLNKICKIVFKKPAHSLFVGVICTLFFGFFAYLNFISKNAEMFYSSLSITILFVCYSGVAIYLLINKKF